MTARSSGIVLAAALVLAACSGSSQPTSTDAPSTTSSSARPTSSTTTAPADLATQPFSVPIGDKGVTYDLDGAPPSGPSSFAVLEDGSVVLADTMAVARGEPRLLHYDRAGDLLAVIGLASEEVAAIVDVVTDGQYLAILDVLVSRNRYRVLTLDVDGTILSTIDVPDGFRFEDGLTGLTWDDSGILLEFRFGARYARPSATGAVVAPVVPVFDGISIELLAGNDRTTEVRTSGATFSIERATDLGGVTLVGIGPDGSIVVVVDEVEIGEVITVTRRIQRYSATGELETEVVIDAADQFLEMSRPFELDPTGNVLYLRTEPDRVSVVPLESVGP